jgi:putative transcriptional regulator
METDNIPALVKTLRQRLGLTQEQFAHEVGVTFSTVNQWENGRRRPQPFLFKRLSEMEATWHTESAGRLKKEEALAFKRRWQAVNAAEKSELASTPVADKFRQAAALLLSADKLGWNRPRSQDEEAVQERWARLWKEYHA